MSETLERYIRAADAFGQKVHAIKDDQWGDATPCTEWDVRALLNHLVYETEWIVPLFAGRTIAEVGDTLEGDRLGDDPRGAWDRAAAAAIGPISEPGALERKVHLSFGDVPGEEYLSQMLLDLVVHGWDLARGIGADDTIEESQAQHSLDWLMPQLKAWQAGGAFADPVAVPDDAPAGARLIAITGRTP